MKPRFTFGFTSLQQKAIVFLVVLIVIVQAIIIIDFFEKPFAINSSKEKKAWEKNQLVLEQKKQKEDSLQKIPKKINPNYITDYRGYRLGISPEAIDRLHVYRKKGLYINSIAQFQEITQISDSLLKCITPQLAFTSKLQFNSKFKKTDRGIPRVSINAATKEDWMQIKGIGDVLSDRILKERDNLGGFVSIEQIGWVYGISPEVFQEVKKSFFLKEVPKDIKRLLINEATLKQLSAFPYFDYALSKQIVIYRTMHGNNISIDDLYRIEGFPKEKVAIIALYLHF